MAPKKSHADRAQAQNQLDREKNKINHGRLTSPGLAQNQPVAKNTTVGGTK